MATSGFEFNLRPFRDIFRTDIPGLGVPTSVRHTEVGPVLQCAASSRLGRRNGLVCVQRALDLRQAALFSSATLL